MFSANHTALILVLMCLYNIADSYDTEIAGYTFEGGENETEN